MAKHVRKLIRILLSESASRALNDAGCRAFAIVGKERTTEHPDRWIIHLRDASHLEAQDAQDVLLGRKIAIPNPALGKSSEHIKPRPIRQPISDRSRENTFWKNNPSHQNK